MFRKLMAGFIALLWSVMALAAVEVNKASEAELTSIKGIGPVMSARILEERKASAFKDWPDFIARVKGVGEPTAAKFSGDGLTVNGSSYKGAKPDAKDTAAKNTAAKDAKDTKDTAAKGAKPTKDQAAKPAMPAKAGAAS